EPDELDEQGKHYLERVAEVRGLFSVTGVFQQLLRFPNVRLTALPSASVEASCHLRIESVERFSGDVTKLHDELTTAAAGDQVLIACHNEAECKRLGEVLSAGATRHTAESEPAAPKQRHGGTATPPFVLVIGHVSAGFRMVDAGI